MKSPLYSMIEVKVFYGISTDSGVACKSGINKAPEKRKKHAFLFLGAFR